MESTKRAIELSHLLQLELGRSFPFIMFGLDQALTETKNPDTPNIRSEAEHVVAGALIVYLFAMWDN